MGEWLGDTAVVVQKMSGAYDLVAERGAKSALTLYFNQDYWAQANVPNRMKTGLDYVWISDYEDDCNGLQPAWEPVFKKRAEMFPSSRVGFGEVGTKYSDRKEGYIDRYYGMKVSVPQYVGGYFWWYFHSDRVPSGGTLWQSLIQQMK